jgi:hypothetical protein
MNRLVVLLVGLGSVASARADCAMTGLAPRVVSAPDVVVPADGGVVVAAVSEARGALDQGDPAVQSGWRMRIGADLIKPPIDMIAPGLAVYRIAAVNTFKVELVDAKQQTVASVRTKRSGGDPTPAPKLKRAWFVAQHSRHGGSAVTVEVEDAPAGAIALVLADDHGKPRSWTLATGATTLSPYAQADCVVMPNGTIPSKAGDKITLFWVDAMGRPSVASKPITVAAKP